MIDPTLKERAIDAITRICLEKALMLTPQEAGMIADAVLALGFDAARKKSVEIINIAREEGESELRAVRARIEHMDMT